MGFLLDSVLVGLLVAVLASYAKKSIFSAAGGAIATVIGVAAALLITPLASPWVAQTAVRPLMEQTVANQLADMHSAVHLSTPAEMLEALPLADWVINRPEAYTNLLEKYNVSPDVVATAYEASPQPQTVLDQLVGPYVTALSDGAVFLLLAILLTVTLQLIVRRMEQNLPPQRRYRGIKRLIPVLFGVLAGGMWSFVAVTVLSWVVPVTAGQLVFLSPAVLNSTDWYTLLLRINPLTFLWRWI